MNLQSKTSGGSRNMSEKEDGGHLWHERVFASMNVRCCMHCGFIKNEKQPNKPCPGPVSVEVRTPSKARQTEEARS